MTVPAASLTNETVVRERILYELSSVSNLVGLVELVGRSVYGLANPTQVPWLVPSGWLTGSVPAAVTWERQAVMALFVAGIEHPVVGPAVHEGREVMRPVRSMAQS